MRSDFVFRRGFIVIGHYEAKDLDADFPMKAPKEKIRARAATQIGSELPNGAKLN